jgi:hypothetical protein
MAHAHRSFAYICKHTIRMINGLPAVDAGARETSAERQDAAKKRKRASRLKIRQDIEAANREFRAGMKTVDCNRNACNDPFTHEVLERVVRGGHEARAAAGDMRRLHAGAFSSECSTRVRAQLQAALVRFYGRQWALVAICRSGGDAVRRAVDLAVTCALSRSGAGGGSRLEKCIKTNGSVMDTVLLVGPQHTGATAEMVDDMCGTAVFTDEPQRWINEERVRVVGVPGMLTTEHPGMGPSCDAQRLTGVMAELERRHKEQPIGCIVVDTCIVWLVDGPLFYFKEFLSSLQEFARRIGALVVVDECLSGLGRTGPALGCQHYPGLFTSSSPLLSLPLTLLHTHVFFKFLSRWTMCCYRVTGFEPDLCVLSKGYPQSLVMMSNFECLREDVPVSAMVPADVQTILRQTRSTNFGDMGSMYEMCSLMQVAALPEMKTSEDSVSSFKAKIQEHHCPGGGEIKQLGSFLWLPANHTANFIYTQAGTRCFLPLNLTESMVSFVPTASVERGVGTRCTYCGGEAIYQCHRCPRCSCGGCASANNDGAEWRCNDCCLIGETLLERSKYLPSAAEI